MQITDTTIRRFAYALAIVIDPVEIDQVLLISDRTIRDCARTLERRNLVERELDRIISLVAQQTIRIVSALQLLAIDREHVVAHIRIHAHFGQRRAIKIFLVLTVKDLRDAIASGLLVKLKTRAGQTVTRPRRNLKIAALDVSVLNRELRDHFTDHVIESRTMGHILQQRLVLLAQRDPVEAVHIRHIEPVAITSPNLVEDLVPFFSRHAIDIQTRSRNGLARSFALRRRVVKVVSGSLSNENFRAVVRKRVAAHVVDERRLLAILQRINAQRRIAIPRATVIKRTGNNVKQVSCLRRQSD